jgi:hypothetical protein
MSHVAVLVSNAKTLIPQFEYEMRRSIGLRMVRIQR